MGTRAGAGCDSGGVLGAIVGGWQFAGIATFTTGRPFTVFMQTGVNNGATSWPNRIGSGKLDDPTVDLWYNPRDFVAPPANTYGDSGRGILYGPGPRNFDTSLSKRFTVVGRGNVEFRWDAFNLLNHPGFGFPNQNFDSPTAGRITSTVGRQSIDAVLAEVQFLRSFHRQPLVLRALTGGQEIRRKFLLKEKELLTSWPHVDAFGKCAASAEMEIGPAEGAILQPQHELPAGVGPALVGLPDVPCNGRWTGRR